MKKVDFIASVICLTVALLLYRYLNTIEPQQAATFPRTIVLIFGLLSAGLLIQTTVSYFKSRNREAGAEEPSGGESASSSPAFLKRFLMVGVMFGMAVIYLYLLESVGFYLDSFLFVFIAPFILKMELSRRLFVKNLMTSAVFTCILYVIFSIILKVQTPRGILF